MSENKEIKPQEQNQSENEKLVDYSSTLLNPFKRTTIRGYSKNEAIILMIMDIVRGVIQLVFLIILLSQPDLVKMFAIVAGAIYQVIPKKDLSP